MRRALRMNARALGCAAVACAIAACSPEITRGTYYCGPERLCPPNLECDDGQFTCETPGLVQPFSCPEESEGNEPDDVVAQALDLGTIECGASPLDTALGCIPDGDDVDLAMLQIPPNFECETGAAALAISVRYPVALVPMKLELLDDEMAVVEAGVLCTQEPNFTGQDKLCIDALPPAGTYYVRVSSDRDAPDCDGDCHYNQYVLSIDVAID